MSKRYLIGPSGSSKTQQLTQRLVELINAGTRPDRILVLLPQLAQVQRFRTALANARGSTRGEPQIGTFYGLAQQHVSLFFPIVAQPAGFSFPQREPVFINVEAAQYFVNQIVAPRMADFDDLKLYRPRLLTQILDSMNKAATSGFGLDELARRLESAWEGEPRRLYSYGRMQDVAQAFRQFCLQHNLLDFSLLMDVYARHLLHTQTYRDYVAARYRHVLADNLEEGTPALHDFLGLVSESCDNALYAEDSPGGYRLFLGADVNSARMLRERLISNFSFVISHLEPKPSPVQDFGAVLMTQFEASSIRDARQTSNVKPQTAIDLGAAKYWTQMVDWVAERIVALVESGVAPDEIAVLAPYVEDVLRFELSERLNKLGIGVRSLRPSRPLFDHPVTRALVVFAKLAHPQWQLLLSPAELARALSTCIEGLDLIRAQLLADAALRIAPNRLAEIDDQNLWNRVGMRFREAYVRLVHGVESEERGAKGEGREALDGTLASRPSPHAVRSTPLDLFWQQLFTDVLSQPGFALSVDLDAAQVCDKLIRSMRAFREVFERADLTPQSVPTSEIQILNLQPKPEEPGNQDIGLEYITLLAEGIMAAQYAPERSLQPSAFSSQHSPDVLLATVYAYLTGDHHSRHQFWLDLNSPGWYERIFQPLTHPYVLRRTWPLGERWSEHQEHDAAQAMMRRVVGGLTARCSEQIHLASSQLSINGQEEAGPLARAVQRVLAAAKPNV